MPDECGDSAHGRGRPVRVRMPAMRTRVVAAAVMLVLTASCASHKALVPPPAVMSEAIRPVSSAPPRGVLAGSDPVWKPAHPVLSSTHPADAEPPAAQSPPAAAPAPKQSAPATIHLAAPLQAVAVTTPAANPLVIARGPDTTGFRKKYVYADHAAAKSAVP